MPIRSSEASSDDLLFRGIWLRMWSSMSSAMRLLMAPLAAASLCRTSAHCSSSLSARKMASSCPMIFLVRLTRSNFSREVCDIDVDYLVGVWYLTYGRYGIANRTRGLYMENLIKEPEPPGSSDHLELRDRRA